MEGLREVKDDGELERHRRGGAAGDRGARGACSSAAWPGRTEREVALAIERGLRERGAEDPSFPAIVAAGAHGALPHAEPRDVEIPPGALVVIDWGARVDGYCSDCTRTIATGPTRREGARRSTSWCATRRSRRWRRCAPGAGCRAVDAVARDLIEAAGHGEQFGHGLGHGVGLEVHEGPRLTKQAEGELEAGNVVTVEPGVYVPGEVGVRIEDLVAVTDDGADVFTSFPKTLVTVD